MTISQKLPIYVLNLDRRPDRLEFMASQLDAQGLEWERHSALDAKTATDEEISREVVLSDQKLRMLRGSQCCAISNFDIWRKIAAADANAAIILQDDVCISDDFAAFANSEDWLPTGFGLVQLEKWGDNETKKLMGSSVGKTPVKGRNIYPLHSRTGGAGAYVITREAAKWALANKDLATYSIDHILFNMNVSPLARSLGVAIVNPFIAIQRQEEFVSNIDNSASQGKTVRQKLTRAWYEINLVPFQFWMMVTGRAKWLPVNYKNKVESRV